MKKLLSCLFVVCLLCSYLSVGVFAGPVYDLREIEIRLVEIKCIAVGPDPGSELEVYGNWGYRYNNSMTTMYSCGDGNVLDISPGRPKVLDVKKVIRVKYGDSISVGGSTMEEDSWWNGDDNMGENYQSIPERDLGNQDDITTISVNYEEGGQKVEAVFEIRTIRFIRKIYMDDWVTKFYPDQARKLSIDKSAIKFSLEGKVFGIVSGDTSTGKVSFSGGVTNATISSNKESAVIKFEGYDVDGKFFSDFIELKKAFTDNQGNP